MEFVVAVSVAALVWKFTDFLKAVTNANWNAVVTQLIAWGAALAALGVVAATSMADTVPVPGTDLMVGQLGFAEILLVALASGSGASALYDAKKAVDNSDSAAQPRLLK